MSRQVSALAKEGGQLMDILYRVKVPQHFQKVVNPFSAKDKAGQPAEFLLEPFLIAAGRNSARVRDRSRVEDPIVFEIYHNPAGTEPSLAPLKAWPVKAVQFLRLRQLDLVHKIVDARVAETWL